MMTTEELKKIANSGGYGTGKFARDRAAAEAECLELLPTDTCGLPAFVASGDDLMDAQIPMAYFGNSDDDGKDWAIYHDGVTEADAIGHDAKDNARIVAAILNAFRMGMIQSCQRPSEKTLIRDLAVILDCCLEWLHEKAEDEEERYTAGTLRAVTWQKRRDKAEAAVKYAFEWLGMEGDD